MINRNLGEIANLSFIKEIQILKPQKLAKTKNNLLVLAKLWKEYIKRQAKSRFWRVCHTDGGTGHSRQRPWLYKEKVVGHDIVC